MFKDFLAWEWDFVNMSKGKPHYMIKKGWDARERIFKRIAKEMEQYEDLATPFIKQRISVLPIHVIADDRSIANTVMNPPPEHSPAVCCNSSLSSGYVRLLPY